MSSSQKRHLSSLGCSKTSDNLMDIFYNFINEIITIITGWVLWAYQSLFNKTTDKVRKRLEICSNCGHNVDGICNICGCIIKAKVRVRYMEDQFGKSINGCDLKKW